MHKFRSLITLTPRFFLRKRVDCFSSFFPIAGLLRSCWRQYQGTPDTVSIIIMICVTRVLSYDDEKTTLPMKLHHDDMMFGVAVGEPGMQLDADSSDDGYIHQMHQRNIILRDRSNHWVRSTGVHRSSSCNIYLGLSYMGFFGLQAVAKLFP